MQEPPIGITLPVKVARVRDGDTVVVQAAGLQFALRLAGVDCPELDTEKGKRAASYLQDMIAKANRISVWIPLPKVKNLFGGLSFDRVVGHLFLDGIDVSEWLIRKQIGKRRS